MGSVFLLNHRSYEPSMPRVKIFVNPQQCLSFKFFTVLISSGLDLLVKDKRQHLTILAPTNDAFTFMDPWTLQKLNMGNACQNRTKLCFFKFKSRVSLSHCMIMAMSNNIMTDQGQYFDLDHYLALVTLTLGSRGQLNSQYFRDFKPSHPQLYFLLFGTPDEERDD